ncbi:MAG: SLBB domain-containing protein [Sphingomicrobium sp.]
MSVRTPWLKIFASQLALCVIVQSAPTAALAQMTSGNPSLPTGSPLDGSSQQQQYNGTQQSPVIQRSGIDTSIDANRVEPVSLIDTERSSTNSTETTRSNLTNNGDGLLDSSAMRLRRPTKPSEFERFVEDAIGRKLPRFGEQLLLPSNRDFATPATSTVPPDYILNPGDVVAVALTGSVEGSVEREIDTNGNIFLPKVGSVRLAGVRYGDLHDRLSAAVGRQYRGYTVSARIQRLRGIRVYVTGFAQNPGAFTVSSLSTIANAVLQAGGPSAGGSFRSAKLYRGGQEVADFDLYELVRGGSRLHDAVLQNEDVLFIPPAGPQVALVGSVNEEAIYEAKPGETLDDMLRYGGGPNSLGDPSRIILYRNTGEDKAGPQQVSRQNAASVPVVGGDILQLLSRGSLAQPVERQSVLVRVEGEVNRPGNYYVAPNTPLASVMALAGGLTSRAFVYGSRFTRESVRSQQRSSYREAVDQLESELAGASVNLDRAVPAADRAGQLEATRTLLDRLRRKEPDGRLVLSLPYGSANLPGDLLLENNDRIEVPPLVNTVGVFGAVYRPASFLITAGRPLRVRDYVDRAGGTLRSADRSNTFLVRANGEVLARRRGALSAFVQPGDVVFVPVKTQNSSLLAKIKDIATILFQFGVTAGAVGAFR